MAKQQTKICPWCGKAKPKSLFHKDKSKPDGLNHVCKQCRNDRYLSGKSLGIDTPDQLGDVLRTMAELQAEINKENARRNHRVSLINKYSDEFIQPLEDQQTGLRGMIKVYLKKSDCREFKKYHFGSVGISRGKLEIHLKPELAERMRGKP